MDEGEFKRITAFILLIVLLVLAYFVLKPILMAVITGAILAYVLQPLYTKLTKRISPNISAFIILIGILVIVLLPIIFFMPVIARQLLNVYLFMRSADFYPIFETILPGMFDGGAGAADLIAITSTATATIANFLFSSFQKMLINIPTILLQSAIVLFTFFFVLRDQEKLKDYFFSVSPFPKEAQHRFYQKFEQITNSVIYGQIVVGIVQGVIAGVGYFIFGVPNALLLTFLTMLVGIIPVIGPWLVWVPIDVYLFATGNTGQGIGLLIYGVFVLSWVDTLIRPLIISRWTKMNSAIALIGMVGGLFAFGIMGLLLGPLILAYLLLVAEFYKERRFKSIILQDTRIARKT